MKIDGLIERDCLASVSSLLTLASCKITDCVQILISSRTVRWIDLDPMRGDQMTTGGNSGLYTRQKSGDCVLSFVVPTTRPIRAFFFVVTLGMIQKRMSMRPTMTSGVFCHYIK